MGSGTGMRTMADVRGLLRGFGSFLYTGDRLADLYLMEEELGEIRQLGMVDRETYLAARRVVLTEISRVRRQE